MIIKNNLASNPTKNYSLFLIGCFFMVMVAVVFTAYNVWTFFDNLQQSRALGKSINEQQQKIRDLNTKSTALNNQISKIKTARFISETEFINNAIKKRTLSWTSLFNRFELVIPDHVKMISIRPVILGKVIGMDLEMAAQNLQDMVETVQKLEADPAFSNVLLRGENDTQADGLLHFSISLQYFPPEESGESVQEGEK